MASLKLEIIGLPLIIAFVVLVGLVQVIAVYQIRLEQAFHEFAFGQALNWISWTLVIGVLVIAHELHPGVPSMNTADLFTFALIALVSAGLCLIACYLRRRIRE